MRVLLVEAKESRGLHINSQARHGLWKHDLCKENRLSNQNINLMKPNILKEHHSLIFLTKFVSIDNFNFIYIIMPVSMSNTLLCKYSEGITTIKHFCPLEYISNNDN